MVGHATVSQRAGVQGPSTTNRGRAGWLHHISSHKAICVLHTCEKRTQPHATLLPSPSHMNVCRSCGAAEHAHPPGLRAVHGA